MYTITTQEQKMVKIGFKSGERSLTFKAAKPPLSQQNL